MIERHPSLALLACCSDRWRFTRNRSAGEWGAVFGDPVLATDILDRLLHHSLVITIGGDSYRPARCRKGGVNSRTSFDSS